MLTKCWGAPPDRLAALKVPTSKGGIGCMSGDGSEGEEIGGEGRKGKGRKGKGCGVQTYP